MPRGYDAQANEAWEQAKVLAEKENRPLTLSDLWWGIWATIPTENLAVALPETIQHRLKELRGKQAVGKVKVSEEVKRSSPMDVMGKIVVRQLARHLSSDDSIGYRFRCSFGCDENDDENKGYLAPGVKASLPCYNWAVADGTLMRSVLFGGWRISRACGWHDDSGLGVWKGI
jgi:hypothetical protein